MPDKSASPLAVESEQRDQVHGRKRCSRNEIEVTRRTRDRARAPASSSRRVWSAPPQGGRSRIPPSGCRRARPWRARRCAVSPTCAGRLPSAGRPNDGSRTPEVLPACRESACVRRVTGRRRGSPVLATGRRRHRVGWGSCRPWRTARAETDARVAPGRARAKGPTPSCRRVPRRIGSAVRRAHRARVRCLRRPAGRRVAERHPGSRAFRVGGARTRRAYRDPEEWEGPFRCADRPRLKRWCVCTRRRTRRCQT